MTLYHSPFLCELCGPSILCGTCGLNACSGGVGKLADGTDCLDCNDAYELYIKGVCNDEGN